MHRQFCACTYESFTTVTEGVIHGVHKVVIRSSSVYYSDIRLVKVLVVLSLVLPTATEGELRLFHGDQHF